MSGYGLGGQTQSTPATEDTAIVAATTAGQFSYSTHQKKVLVFNDPDSGVNLKVKWNAADAATDEWDGNIQPGASFSSPDGCLVKILSIWVDGVVTPTYLDDFQLRGFN